MAEHCDRVDFMMAFAGEDGAGEELLKSLPDYIPRRTQYPLKKARQNLPLSLLLD